MTGSDPEGFSAESEHDHAACLSHALAQAERVCAEQGKRLTPLRRQVLELIWADHHPVKAYDLLERLRAEQGKVAPPTVYRALEFLEGAGLIHRLESRHAFVGCPEPGHAGPVHFLICRECENVVERPLGDIADRIAEDAAATGFAAERQVLEVNGLCPRCREAAGAAGGPPGQVGTANEE